MTVDKPLLHLIWSHLVYKSDSTWAVRWGLGINFIYLICSSVCLSEQKKVNFDMENMDLLWIS
jgi:hypothetical protein